MTGVADRAADRIEKLVCLDAANPVNGQGCEVASDPTSAGGA